ncbi:hypothetical protein ACFQNF_13975 [Iodobacter arcticus]|uniref:DUF306 domain-containing protein n=1 Tax=Iodobacter arcticus TaxID=590593 RepID=A0ABW2QZK7_9NEIS
MQKFKQHHATPRQLSLAVLASLALSLPAWADNTALPKAGQYNANNKLFERTLVISENGQFSLEVLGKSAETSSRSGSGEGKLKVVSDGWHFSEGNCQMNLSPAKDGLLMRVEGCAGKWGDVMFNGHYQYKSGNGSATSMPAASAKHFLNPDLAKALNCQSVEFNDAGVAKWLAQMANLPLNQVWGKELKVAAGYTFQGLPVQSAILFESETPFLAMLVDADKTTLTAAVKKSKPQKNGGVARLRKNGELSTEGFAGKGAEALYVSCATRKIVLPEG